MSYMVHGDERPQPPSGKGCDPEAGECAHCGDLGPANKMYQCDNKCGCHSPAPRNEGEKGWEEEWAQEVDHLIGAMPNRKDYMIGSTFRVLALPFIRSQRALSRSQALEEAVIKFEQIIPVAWNSCVDEIREKLEALRNLK
jgi:hypothetical protein